MYEVDRRYLLSALGILTASGILPWRASAAEMRPRNLIDAPRFPTPPFTLGVAAGDPDASGFVIWTRLAPLPLQPDGGMMMAPVLVAWEVAADPDFRQLLQHGETIAHPELAHSVHVEVAGLAPARPYWYRFTCGGERSAVGRGATLPLPGAPLDRVRFAVAGCQQYEEGYYTAWRHIAAEPIDFVFHYGDYIYEGPDRGEQARGAKRPLVRRHLGHEIYSIGNYRQR